MHDDIKRFELVGQVTHDKFVATREALIKNVEGSMRDEGYVPVLDLHPQFTRQYDAEREVFDFHVSVYGVHVGEQAWQIAGMTNGRLIERSTHPTK